MIRLWLARGTSVPIREQLTSQFILGILSQRLAPGERLPSVRQLARLLKLHPNTISAAYRDLGRRGWVGHRRGGGVFVRQLRLAAPGTDVTAWARAAMAEGREQGFPVVEMQAAFAALREDAGDEFLVVDPDGELARVLSAEISDVLGRPVAYAALSSASGMLSASTTVLASGAWEREIAEALGPVVIRAIPLRSMQDVLTGLKRPALPVLIGVVSRSPSILKWAATLLSALGFPEDCVVLRNPAQKAWRNGLKLCHIVGADVMAATELPATLRPVTFRLISQQFLDELGAAVTLRKLS